MAVRKSLAPWVVAISALGCNAILGIERGHLVNVDGGSGGSAGTGGSSTGGSSGTKDAGAMGGAAAGGQAGSGTGGSSSGGQGGAVGTGGIATDGGAKDGGVRETPADVAGEIRCGKEICQIASGQSCCVAILGAAAHCSKSCDSSTQVKFTCDGAEDCNSGDTCCYLFSQTTASCVNSCATTDRAFCGSDKDCTPGQYCAPGEGDFEPVFVCKDIPKVRSVFCAGAPCDVANGNVCCYDKAAKTEQCTSKCTGTEVVPFACDGTDDCDAAALCCATHTGLNLFTGTQCLSKCAASADEVLCRGPGLCPAGQSCCLNGTQGTSCTAGCASPSTCANSADCVSPATPACSPITATGIGQSTGVATCQ